MQAANPTHKTRIVEILSKSFADNKSTNYVVKNDHKRLTRIKSLVAYSFEVCHAFGECWISDDHDACALILFPEKKKSNLKSLSLDFQLAYQCIGLRRVAKILKREAHIHQYHPQEPYYYLWFVGIEPAQQGKGIGSAFMKEILQRYDEDPRPIYLETSTLKNLPWYQKFGFEIYHELDFGFPVYQLRRK